MDLDRGAPARAHHDGLVPHLADAGGDRGVRAPEPGLLALCWCCRRTPVRGAVHGIPTNSGPSASPCRSARVHARGRDGRGGSVVGAVTARTGVASTDGARLLSARRPARSSSRPETLTLCPDKPLT